MAKKGPPSLRETFERGFVWMVLFVLLGLMFCKWFAGA